MAAFKFLNLLTKVLHRTLLKVCLCSPQSPLLLTVLPLSFYSFIWAVERNTERNNPQPKITTVTIVFILFKHTHTKPS